MDTKMDTTIFTLINQFNQRKSIMQIELKIFITFKVTDNIKETSILYENYFEFVINALDKAKEIYMCNPDFADFMTFSIQRLD